MKKQVIIQIGENYQFGEVVDKIDQDTIALSRKILHFEREEQHQIIKQMVHFLKVARHDSLINVQKVLQAENQVHIFYQYVPLRLERWVLDVDEELIDTLEEQLLQLAQFLSRSSIRFTFDPNSIGLTQQMHIKYFLKEFTVDIEHREQNLVELQADIRAYFRQLSGVPQKIRNQSLSTTSSISMQGKSLSIGSQDSDRLRGLTLGSNLQLSSPRNCNSKISAKVYSSMMKSLQVLQRFKKMSVK